MSRLTAVLLTSLFVASSAFAQPPAAEPATQASPDSSCEAKAVDKNGKPLAGAAKSSFMKKCHGEMSKMSKNDCATKAMDKNGKPLAGAAKNSFMKKCMADAKAAK
ncbi:MAG TPA: hypothetical protein VJ673_12835 [Aromatoleum sp.]|uniref:hypothetical protein n=1 Tax=Aromatoleum sp. TaxID=2307007 RepID=UPI002B494B6A|nr:hypothetical protein [Aromatoleum sp.]HJV26566.1 hypothetical protein [Aromatoleum sp.]